MKAACSLFVMLLLFSISHRVQAAASKKYEFDISSLVGMHSQADLVSRLSLSIEKFEQISNIELFLEGEAFPGSAYRSAGGVRIPITPQIEINIQLTDRFRNAFITGTPIVAFGPLNGSFKDQKSFEPHAGIPTDWSFAKKGKGVLILQWGMGCPGYACSYIEHSKVAITKAKLVIDGVLQSDSAQSNRAPSGKEKHEPSRPRVVDVFACSDYCPGPKEMYMEIVYEGVTDEKECRKLGGRPASFVGWGTHYICIAE